MNKESLNLDVEKDQEMSQFQPLLGGTIRDRGALRTVEVVDLFTLVD